MIEIDVAEIRPIAGDEIWRLARTEYLRTLALLRQLEAADWQRVLDVNLTGVFHCAQQAARLGPRVVLAIYGPAAPPPIR